MPTFIAITSLFSLGAAWFRKAHFIKTLLTLVVIGIGTAVIAAIVGWFVFGAGFYIAFSSNDVYL